MTTYTDEIEKKKFEGNVVILLGGEYYSIRQPDSGLAVPGGNNGMIKSFTVNPSRVDLKRVNQTISSYNFRILDKAEAVSRLFEDSSNLLIETEVRAFIGRTGVGMDFADYLELPKVFVERVSHRGPTYDFRCKDSTDTMRKPVFNAATILKADILNNTTSIQVNSTSSFPSSGFFKIGNEIISYTSKTSDTFEDCTRGEFSTTPAEHNLGDDVFEVIEVEDNPINLLLQILISGGGGGAYDVLPKGLGIDQSLIDITEMEAIRDETFSGETFNFLLYDIEDTLKFIEKEILLATGTRFKVSSEQKISLARLDQSSFDEASENPIDENSITRFPNWSVQRNEILTKIVIKYDYDEARETYREVQEFVSQDAITNFGEIRPLTYEFKGVRESLSGAAFINSLGLRLLERFDTARPEISIDTHINQSLLNVGDKVLLSSSKIPSASGSLNFADSLEIVSRAINHINGTVKFKLQFTSYAGIRGAYIAPCTPFESIVSQSEAVLPAGRGDEYEVGWKVLLWNSSTYSYEPDPVNTIAEINGDNVIFENEWNTTLDDSVHAIRFAPYDQVTLSQKRFAFIGAPNGGTFNDGSGAYKILV